MKPAPGVWGIDLGQCALKALRIQQSEEGLAATAFDFIEYPKILSQPDADPDQLIREALTQFLSRNTVKGDTVAISVPGQSGLARFVKLPPVEEKKIADIVKFEAKQQIPFNLDEVIWDYQKIGSGEVVDGLALETEIGLFAMKRDMVDRYMKHFKDVGVEVHYIQMAPLALCNYISFDLLGRGPDAADDGKKSCVVGLDIGTDTSNMVITDGGRIIWQRPIPLGGNHFTRAITKDLKLTFAKAEHLKRNAAKSGPVELKKILGAIKPVLSDFVGEAQRSLNFFTNTHRDANIEYMIGLGNAFRLPGFQKYLAEKLQLTVKKLDKLQHLAGDEVTASPIFVENMPTFAVSYGLALQGLARARLLTNLLPQEVRVERLIRGKKPWAVAAAGLLLLGVAGVAMGAWLDQRPYTASGVEAAVKDAEKAAGDVKASGSKFTAAKGAAEKEEAASKSIVAGQFERANWLALARFIGDSIPQPDGTNLPPEARARYFDLVPKDHLSGKNAYEVWLKSSKAPPKAATPPKGTEGETPMPGVGGGMGGDSAPASKLPVGIDDLVQFNIQSIDSRYCDDLASFWKEASKGKEADDVAPAKEDAGKKVDITKYPAPEGKGWVIEVSGYTFHHDKESFIRAALLKKLADNATKLEAGKPSDPPADKAKGGGGVADFESTKEPVVGKVSHVLLYRYRIKQTSDTSGYELINESPLGSLTSPSQSGGTGTTMPGGSPPGGSAPPPGGTSAPPGGSGTTAGGSSSTPTRSAWTPLGSRASAASNPMGRGNTGPNVGGPAGGPVAAPADKETHSRTEFIILFIWKEPTPSDSLRGAEGAGQLPPAQGPGGGGRGPGFRPPMGSK